MKRIVVAMALLVPVIGHADSPLRAEDAIHLALAHSPLLDRARARVDAAKAGVGDAKTAYLPDLNVGVSGTAGFGGSITSATGVRGLMGSPFTQNIGAGVEGSWLVYDFGRRERRVEAASAEVDGARALAALDRRSIALRAADAFERAADSQATVAQLDALLAARKRAAAQARSLADAGLRSGVEAELAAARALDAEAEVELFRASSIAALAQLEAALGGVPVTGPLATDAPDALVVDAWLAPRPSAPEPLEQVAAAEGRRAAALSRAATDEHLPRIVIAGSAGYARRDPDPGYWAAGAGLVWPILSFIRERARADVAAARAKAAAADAKQADLETAAAIASERARLSGTMRAIAAAEKGADAAQRSVAAAETRYGAGMLSFIEVDEAYAQLAAALVRLAHARVALSTTVARLQVWSGDALR